MANAAPQFLVEDKARHDRWAHLTESLQKDRYMKAVVETIMDNTKVWAENAATTQNVQTFTTFAFPLIRRIFPSLIANQLVSIQPLTMPSGMIFYFDLKYGKDMAPTARGDRMDYQANPNKFNAQYASGRVRGMIVGTGDGSNKAFTVTGYSPIDTDSVVGYVSSTPATVASVVDSGGTVTITFSAAPTDEASVSVDFNMLWEGNGNAGDVEFDMSSDTISVEQKRMRARWTLEAQQDLYAYHGLDAEAELTAVLGDEIRREIDRNIVDDLYGNVGGNVNWSQTKGETFDGSTKEYNETLMHAMLDADNVIYKKRLVRSNWVVMHPDIVTRLEKINSFRITNAISQTPSIGTGANVFGTLNGRWNIITDPLAPTNKILMGYKGNSFFQTGYVYAPYQPLYTSPTIIDADMTPRKAVMTRFGRKVVSSDFYATVTIGA